ncbi:uncharacterized protein PAE49_007274 isoform 3-T3 [Odontesthes bonariensis]
MSAALSATNQSIPEKVDRDQSLQRFGLDGRIAVSEAPAAKTFPENTKGRTTWLSRLFSRILKKDQIQTKSNNKPSEQKQRVDSSDGATTTTAPQPEEKNKQRKKKKSCWRLFSCCRDTTRARDCTRTRPCVTNQTDGSTTTTGSSLRPAELLFVSGVRKLATFYSTRDR